MVFESSKEGLISYKEGTNLENQLDDDSKQFENYLPDLREIVVYWERKLLLEKGGVR